MASTSNKDRSEIVFFDVEVRGSGRNIKILEFGAILVCPEKLTEVQSYSTLVRPAGFSIRSKFSDRVSNGITKVAILSSPTFRDIANKVYDLLDGRIWAGHNILSWDCVRIREAFAEIGQPAPEHKGTIDTLRLLNKRFGEKRAGNMKMDTLATHFGFEPQTHRSLDDVRMNLEVLKYCATVLLLEEPSKVYEGYMKGFLEPDEISISSINESFVPFFCERQRKEEVILLHLRCSRLEVRFGIIIDQKYAGRQPRLNFVVNASRSLSGALHACNAIAHNLFLDSGSRSVWRPVVRSKYGNPTAKLNIQIAESGDIYETKIYKKEYSGTVRRFRRFDPEELKTLFTPGTFVDAFFSLDPYDYHKNCQVFCNQVSHD